MPAKVPALNRARLARRVGVAAVAIAATTAGLVGCSSGSSNSGSSSSGVTKLDYWGWVPGVESLVSTWNKQNPDIQVKFHRMTGDDSQKVTSAVQAGSGPDIVQLSTDQLTNYVINGWSQDISQYVSKDKSNYTPTSWKSVNIDGKAYGLPQGIGPAAMLYRSDIFSKYHIAVPKTWDQYVTAAKALHKADPTAYIANISPTESAQWQIEVDQAGASLYGTQGQAWKVAVDGSQSQQVASRWQSLLDDKLITTETMWTPAYWKDVNSGKIATITEAAWFPALLEENAKKTSGKWQVAPMPSSDGSPVAGDSGGSVVTVLKGAKDPAAASKFISWLDGSDATQAPLIEKGGLFPSTLNGLKSKALYKPQPFFNNQVINNVFEQAAKHEPTTWAAGPNYDTAFQAIGDQFSKVVTGKQTFSQAIDKAQSTTVSNLKSRGLSVAK